jgi:large subunit ribosomal protein L38
MIEMRKAQRANPELERAARNRTLEVDLDDVSAEYLDCGDLFIDIREAADLYGVYEDLFDKDTLFTPSRYMEVRYDVKDDRDLVLPVHRGNIVKPKEATVAPNVAWQVEDGDEDALWTLVMTTPDGHFKDESSEYLHWMVGNIKGDDLATGTLLCEYMQPFPPFGTGYHRYVFVLYKQVRLVTIPPHMCV